MEIKEFLSARLKWMENELGEESRRLMLGGIYVGEIHWHGNDPATEWMAWFSDECEGNSLGLFDTEDNARKAVEQRFYDAIDFRD